MTTIRVFKPPADKGRWGYIDSDGIEHYASELYISDATLQIDEQKRTHSLKTGDRNQHAWVVGTRAAGPVLANGRVRFLTFSYTPQRGFFHVGSGRAIPSRLSFVHFSSDGSAVAVILESEAQKK